MKRQNLKYYIAGAVSLLTFLVYLTSLQNEFVNWDDNEYVYENLYIRSFDLIFFRWAFFDFYAANWHPLTWISHALDYAAWGLNPLGHHLTNNILHAVNTFLVVLLVVRLIETASILNSPYPPLRLRGGAEPEVGALSSGGVTPSGTGASRFTLIAAATTGLLFGLHPIHVESVAWVAERKDLLCALFYLLSIMAYVQSLTPADLTSTHGIITPPPPSYLKRGWRSRGRYILSLAFFTLALMSKPMAVTLPVVLLILDWYPFGRIVSFKTFRTAFVEKIPFIALSVFSSVVTILAQHASGAIRSIEIIPLLSRVIVAAQSLTTYIWKMMAPFNLVPLYTYPRNVSLLSAEYLLPIVLVGGVTMACIIAAKKQKLWLSVWCYYVVSLFPVIGIVQVGGQSMADRYTYLPGLGPFLIFGLAAAWSWGKLTTLKRWGPELKAACAAVLFFVFVSTTYLTFKQIGIWENSIDLWSHVIRKEPLKVNLAYYMRGVVFQEQGDFDKAMADYNMVNILEPFHFEVYISRGSIHEKMGRTDKAIEDYTSALAINPQAEGALIGRGILYGKDGQFDRAIEDFNRLIEINPNYPPAYVNRGTAYSRLDQDGRALADFNKAIELDQNYANVYVNRGSLYLKTGDKEHAASDYRKACSLGDRAGCDALRTL